MSEDLTRSIGGSSDWPTAAPVPSPSGERRIDGSGATRLGRYVLRRVIGQGGMGTVYEAEQESPRRVVALKVIRAESISPDLLRRFSQESQVLGRLQHPGIAQVFEAGTYVDDSGRETPYFAMEFIRGVPLSDFAQQRQLGTRERLGLMANICDAVAHAHQKGVIHRDLKPGNILVDESGKPKILDFGVARATDSDIQVTTIRTDIGQLIGTVPYMSPEQIGGDPSDLDTRSDVYALGVMLYELLAGRPPYDLRRKMLHEAARIIREEEPSRLSAISRTLRGDIETIVAKSLEKDKSHRYQSAEALGADLRRYLRDEPISARPASTWYQMRKFSRRNRALVAGVGAVFVVLIAGLAGTMWQARRADERARAAEEARAASELARAQSDAVVAFMQNAMLESDPFRQGSQGATVLEAMEEALKRIEAGALKDQPIVEAQLRFTIADVLDANGRPNDAVAVGEPALAVFRAEHPDGDSDLALALLFQAQYLNGAERIDESLPMFHEALKMIQRHIGSESRDAVMAMSGIGSCLQSQGRYKEALAQRREALAIARRLDPPSDDSVGSVLEGIGSALVLLERHEEALAIFQESLEINRRFYSGDSPQLASSLNAVAYSYDSLERYEEALAFYRQGLEMEERLFNEDHPRKAVTINNIAHTLQNLGRLEEALEFHQRALAMRRRVFQGDHPTIAQSISNIALTLENLGRRQETLPMLEESLAMRRRLYDGDHPQIVIGLYNLAAQYRETGRAAEALTTAKQALEMARRVFDEQQPMRGRCERMVQDLEAKAATTGH